MDIDDLAAALRACAAALYPLHAGVALLISNGTPMAAIDRDAAVTALNAGELPCLRRRTTHPPASRQPCR